MERIDYEDTPAYEAEFTPSASLASVTENFDESGVPLFSGASDDTGWDGGGLEDGDDDFGVGADEFGLEADESAPLDWGEVSAWFAEASAGQRHDFLQSVTPEQSQALMAQYAQSQVDAQLEQVASFHDRRNAYQAERAAQLQAQDQQALAHGHEVLAEMIAEARQAVGTRASPEEVEGFMHQALETHADEWRQEGYSEDVIVANILTPENIEQAVHQAAELALRQEKIQSALGRGPFPGGSWVRPK